MNFANKIGLFDKLIFQNPYISLLTAIEPIKTPRYAVEDSVIIKGQLATWCTKQFKRKLLGIKKSHDIYNKPIKCIT